MSVRFVYDVLIDGKIVFSGSKASAYCVYESFMCYFSSFGDIIPFLSIAFHPTPKRGVKEV